MTQGWFAIIVLLAFTAATEGSVSAETAEERAAALFLHGREAMKVKDFAQASLEFTESDKLDPSPGTVLNLAVCEERLGHLLRAKGLIDVFFARVPADDDRRATAEQLSQDLQARIPKLVIQLAPTGVPGTEVLVDDVRVDSPTDQALRMDPGIHRISVRAPQHFTSTSNIGLVERETATTLILLTLEPARPIDAAPIRKVKRGLPSLFYFALGTGIAGALTAAETGALVLTDRAKVSTHCQSKVCDQAGLDAARRGRLYAAINTVSIPVALAGASIAAYFVIDGDWQSNSRLAFRLAFTPHDTVLHFEANMP